MPGNNRHAIGIANHQIARLNRDAACRNRAAESPCNRFRRPIGIEPSGKYRKITLRALGNIAHRAINHKTCNACGLGMGSHQATCEGTA